MTKFERVMERSFNPWRCGKRCHSTRESAERAMRRTVELGKTDPMIDWRLHAYRCERCQAWHWGHNYNFKPAAPAPAVATA